VDLQPSVAATPPIEALPGASLPGEALPAAAARHGDAVPHGGAELSRGQRLALPLALGATAVCGCAAIALVDPGDDGVPLCWSRSVFGVDCPFCGGLRCTNALLRGNLGEAIDHNVVLAAALPVAVLMWVWWVARSWRGEPSPVSKAPNWLVITAAILLVVFGVVRNLTGTALSRWLHSDLYAG
jgi:hypothetical protein